MCHFITLIAATDEMERLDAVMRRFGRAAWAMGNPSVARAMAPGERQYLTCRGHCDCGTVLGAGEEEDPTVRSARNEAEARVRMERKGWSAAKIERALAQQRHAKALPGKAKTGPDSLALWADIVAAVQGEFSLPSVGLLVHMYGGDQSTEVFEVSRRAAGRDVLAALAGMGEDEVVVIG